MGELLIDIRGRRFVTATESERQDQVHAGRSSLSWITPVSIDAMLGVSMTKTKSVRECPID